ncbi:TFIIH p62 subunit domain-containing protein [Pestalotiopsis sp. NC0098]|nr:TFIIH p62 subunit domain-containing protein [Pestalotiopsis sp. NC0098]
MAQPRGTAVYKKKDGTITVTDDQKLVTWTPAAAPGGPPVVSLAIANITNLQQTPDSSPKVMLKIFEKSPGAEEPTPYLFNFNSGDDPRGEANTIKELLSRLLAELRSNDPSVPRPSASAAPGPGAASTPAGSGSGSMAFASAVNAKPAGARVFDDGQIKSDIALQQSLMKADHSLHEMYMEARTTKPETMSDATFNAQFWSTRLNLLRAHAIETGQKKGPYNILSVAKPISETSADPNQPDRQKLSITVEQVQLILNQHPLVKRIYNENVPPLTENEFWERFFLSKLVKKLRGERLTASDEHMRSDKVFDKYNEFENITAFSSKLLTQHVPHIIDVEGNEENQGGFKGGNKKDVEMRQKGWKDVPIVQTLNSISGKLLVNVTPADAELMDPARPEQDDVYGQLALRDLQGDAEEQRVILNIREQSRFFSAQRDASSSSGDTYGKQDPAKALRGVKRDVSQLYSGDATGVDLHAAIGINDDSDSEEESAKRVHVGSRSSRTGAHKQILDSMKQRKAQLFGSSSDDATPMGLPADIASRCNLTHATTMEFINQFWSAFLSGDPDRAVEVGYLVESLKRCKERIEVVAAEAEKAREDIIAKRKEEIVRVWERTKKKIKFNSKSVKGGRDAVEKLMQPVMHSLSQAISDYQRALASEGVQVSTES